MSEINLGIIVTYIITYFALILDSGWSSREGFSKFFKWGIYCGIAWTVSSIIWVSPDDVGCMLALGYLILLFCLILAFLSVFVIEVLQDYIYISRTELKVIAKDIYDFESTINKVVRDSEQVTAELDNKNYRTIYLKKKCFSCEVKDFEFNYTKIQNLLSDTEINNVAVCVETENELISIYAIKNLTLSRAVNCPNIRLFPSIIREFQRLILSTKDKQ